MNIKEIFIAHCALALRKSVLGHQAFAFYSAALHKTQPASTRAFGKKHSFWAYSKTINILWRGASIEAASREVQERFPDAAYRGSLAYGDMLVDWGQVSLKITGPHIKSDEIENGPIKRTESKKRNGFTKSRANHLRLVKSVEDESKLEL